MPLEIERKFLVRNPPLLLPVPSTDHHITQFYLRPKHEGADPKLSRRLRITKVGFETVRTYNEKFPVSPGIYEEKEQEVSVQESDRLLREQDESLLVVRKTRRVFSYEGNLFELDLFLDELYPYVVLEVELPRLDYPIVLPPFLPIIRELTGEKNWSNRAMANPDWSPT